MNKTYRLSHEQQRIWTEGHLNPESCAYNTDVKFEIIGKVDIKRFRAAVDIIAQQFDSFRTTFQESESGLATDVYQVISEESFCELEYIDVTLSATLAQAKTMALLLLREKLSIKFDLSERSYPVLFLIKFAPNQYYFAFVIHHIFSDGASGRLFMKTLSTAYNEGEEGVKKLLADSDRTMGEYIEYVEKNDSPEKQKAAEKYWLEYLKDAKFELNFEEQSFDYNSRKGKRVHFSINRTQTKALQSLARQERTSLFVVLAATFKTLLYRYFGQDDIIIGYPVNVRPPEFKNLFNFFVNDLPLRTQLSAQMSFIDLVQNITAQRKATKPHQTFSLTNIVNLLRQKEKSFEGQIFNVSLSETSNNFSIDDVTLNGLQVKPLNHMDDYYDEVNDELALIFERHADRLEMAVEYRSAIFERSFIDDLILNFQTLLDELLSNPRKVLLEYNIVNEKSQHLIAKWNDVRHVNSGETISQLFAKQAKNTPNLPAAIFEGESLSYKDLDKQSSQLAHLMQSRNIGEGDVVAVSVEKGFDLLIALYATLKIGAIYLPVDYSYPKERLDYILTDSGAKLIITQQKLQKYFPKKYSNILLVIDEVDIKNQPLNYVPDNRKASDPAYIIYTSGSTGKPKGVLVSHQNLVTRLKWLTENLKLEKGAATLSNINYSFDPSIYELIWPLTIGAHIILPKYNSFTDAGYIIDLMNMHKVQMTTFTPSILNAFLTQIESGDCADLKHAICGGEILSPKLKKNFHEFISADLYNVYGPTETTIITTAHKCLQGDEKTIAIGKPITDTTTYILNDELELQPIGAVGELYVGGNCVALGYLNRPDLNAERFIADPFSSRKNAKLYRTGDLVKYRQNGDMEYIGRIDDQVKIRGFRIEIGEIEGVMRSLDNVEDAAVICVNGGKGDKHLAAYIVVDDAELTIKKIRHKLLLKLPKHMVPSAFVILDKMPITNNGKTDRKSLPIAPLFNDEEKYISPQSKTERALAIIWRSILGRKKISIIDGFFNIGGDSLKVIELVAHVEKEMGVKLDPNLIYDYSTIEILAQYIDQPQLLADYSAREVDFDSEVILDEEIKPLQKGKFITLDKAENILLTGATGFVGAFLLAGLLKKSNATIYCIVRAESDESAKDRLIKNLQYYEIFDEQAFNAKVKIIRGDLAQKDFGIKPSEYDKLAQEIDVIYHCGALVNFVYDYQHLKQANVESAKDIIKFACTDKVKTLHYLSTMSVFQTLGYSGVKEINEKSPLIAPEQLINGYAQSKFVSEKLVAEVEKRGLPVCIYRFPVIVADSRTGITQGKDAFFSLIKGSLRINSFFDMDINYNLITIDYLVGSVLAFSRKAIGLKHRIFHLVNFHLLNTEELIECLHQYGYDVHLLQYEKWLKKLQNSIAMGQTNELEYLMSLLTVPIVESNVTAIEMLDKSMCPKFTGGYTSSILERSGIRMVPIDYKILAKHLDYFIKKQGFPSPNKLCPKKVQ